MYVMQQQGSYQIQMGMIANVILQQDLHQMGMIVYVILQQDSYRLGVTVSVKQDILCLRANNVTHVMRMQIIFTSIILAVEPVILQPFLQTNLTCSNSNVTIVPMVSTSIPPILVHLVRLLTLNVFFAFILLVKVHAQPANKATTCQVLHVYNVQLQYLIVSFVTQALNARFARLGMVSLRTNVSFAMISMTLKYGR